MEQNLQQVLTEAAKDLFYPSESDYPFEYIEWELADSESLTEHQVLASTGRPVDTPSSILSFEDFFAPVTEVKDWYGEEEKKTVERYVALREKLPQTLTNLQVYKVGTIESDVYIVGKAPSGKWVGLRTKVVET